MLYMEGDEDLLVMGNAVDVSTPINLVTGWNWIGYLPQGPLGVDDALSSVSDSAAYITSQHDGFSTNYDDYGWYGSLESMNAGRGYMLQMDAAGELVYPSYSDTSFSRLVSTDNTLNVPPTISDWSVNYADYQYVGSITASIEDRGDFDGDMVAVFVDDKCRGVAERMYFPFDDRYYYLIQVYSNVTDGEELTFKYYSSSTDEVVEYSETVPFTSNMVIGNGFNTFGLSQDIAIPVEFSLGRAYPNPFNPATTLRFALPTISEVSLTVYNLQGRQVISLVSGNMDAGYHSVDWNADKYPSGVYFVKMVAGNYISTQKLMLIK